MKGSRFVSRHSSFFCSSPPNDLSAGVFGLFRRYSGVNVLPRLHFDMQPQLVIQIMLQPRPPKYGRQTIQ